eukprot:6632521-Prymnesium_polylepis.1
MEVEEAPGEEAAGEEAAGEEAANETAISPEAEDMDVVEAEDMDVITDVDAVTEPDGAGGQSELIAVEAADVDLPLVDEAADETSSGVGADARGAPPAPPAPDACSSSGRQGWEPVAAAMGATVDGCSGDEGVASTAVDVKGEGVEGGLSGRVEVEAGANATGTLASGALVTEAAGAAGADAAA